MPSEIMTTPAPSEVDKMEHLVKLGEGLAEKFLGFLPALAGALLVLVVGCAFIKCFTSCLKSRLLAKNAQKKQDAEYEECSDEDSEDGTARTLEMGGLASGMPADGLDPTLVNFGMSIVNALMKLALVIVVCGMVGIKTTSIIAIFTASTLAVGLALKGLITDLANGVMLIIFRPFVHGDRVNVADKEGRVVELSMFRTVLETDAGVRVIIPNSKIDIIEVAAVPTTSRVDR